jgi:hypothetical protein
MELSEWELKYWNEHVQEGEQSYEYLITNFHKMFDGDTIKHFNIRYVTPQTIIYIDDIKEKYINELQKELIPWINIEFECGRLTNKNNWKPFRDRYSIELMYLGYNKLFQYKQYYFQLVIESDIWDCVENCPYCIENESLTHFELALYGWKDEEFEKIQPDNNYIVSSDNMMPEKDWNNNNWLIKKRNKITRRTYTQKVRRV